MANQREHRCGPNRGQGRRALPWGLLVGTLFHLPAFGQTPEPPIAEVPQESAIARLILDTLQEDPPQTVEEQLDAVRILLNIDQGAKAKEYLQALAAMHLSEADLRRLHARFGSVFFLELTVDRRVADVAQGLVDRIFDAVRTANTAPESLSEQVAQLTGGNAEQIRIARDTLRDAGDWGVVALLQGAQSANLSASEAAELRSILLELGALHPEPIIAAARGGDPELSIIASGLLAAMTLEPHQATRVAPILARSPVVAGSAAIDFPVDGGIPARRELDQRLDAEIRRLWSLADPREDETILWYWDVPSRQLVPKSMIGPIADLVVASQIAEDWMTIAPGAEPPAEWYLGSILAATQWSQGMDRTIPDGPERQFAVSSPRRRVQRVLRLALDERQEAAAIAACHVLALQGDPYALVGESPLMRALRDRSARIRFAALSASIQLAPRPTLTGAAHLWQEAWRTLATRGERRIMIVDPNGQRAARVASLASQAGWSATVTRDSRECIRLLRQSPDFELILIHDHLSTPSWTELVQQLQFDVWTAELPIVVLYDVDEPRRATVNVAVEQYPVPVDGTTWQSLIDRVFPAETATLSGIFRRLERARQVRPWAAQIVESESWQPIHQLDSIDRVPTPGMETR